MQALQEQARMLGGALNALSAREEALVTMQTLAADLVHKRARAEALQGSSHRNAVRLDCCLHVQPGATKLAGLLRLR